MKKFIIQIFLVICIAVMALLPTHYLGYDIGFYISIVLLIGYAGLIYYLDGVFFGVRIYPYGIKYSHRKGKARTPKKPKKKGKQNYKRKK